MRCLNQYSTSVSKGVVVELYVTIISIHTGSCSLLGVCVGSCYLCPWSLVFIIAQGKLLWVNIATGTLYMLLIII